MRRPDRNTPSYWAFIGHRVSGLLLAAFLPLHFLALGLALEGEAALNSMLAFTKNPVVKAAEWGLVVLFALHLFFGVRLLALELLPWQGAREKWVTAGAGGALVIGVIFLTGVM
ncbi:MAG: succinate dehydrogenase, cytochrome b556 subunit [Pseudomonadota bacterium]